MFSLGAVCRRVPDLKILLYREIHRNYYDALGLTPKASQGDIKKAYYKMSMVYHPDKGAENSVKFQEICTAYEVLGNNKLRKLYDKGLLPTGAAKINEVHEQQRATSANEDTIKGSSQYKSQSYDNFYDNVNTNFDEKSRKKTTGKSQHYDYDAWTQAHYSETFAKQEFRKAAKHKNERIKAEKLKQMDAIVTTIFFITVAIVVYNVQSSFNNDTVRTIHYKPRDQ